MMSANHRSLWLTSMVRSHHLNACCCKRCKENSQCHGLYSGMVYCPVATVSLLCACRVSVWSPVLCQGPGVDGVCVHLGLSHVWSPCEVLFVLSFWSSRNGSREAVKCVFSRESRATEQGGEETGGSSVNDCLDVSD